MSTCERCGKHTYPNQRTAIRVLLGALRKRGGGLRYYRCPVGAGWHLTSKPLRWWEAA